MIFFLLTVCRDAGRSSPGAQQLLMLRTHHLEEHPFGSQARRRCPPMCSRDIHSPWQGGVAWLQGAGGKDRVNQPEVLRQCTEQSALWICTHCCFAAHFLVEACSALPPGTGRRSFPRGDLRLPVPCRATWMQPWHLGKHSW